MAMGWTADKGSWYVCSGQLKPIYTQGPGSLQCADLCGCVLSSLFLPAVSSLIFPCADATWKACCSPGFVRMGNVFTDKY